MLKKMVLVLSFLFVAITNVFGQEGKVKILPDIVSGTVTNVIRDQKISFTIFNGNNFNFVPSFVTFDIVSVKIKKDQKSIKFLHPGPSGLNVGETIDFLSNSYSDSKEKWEYQTLLATSFFPKERFPFQHVQAGSIFLNGTLSNYYLP